MKIRHALAAAAILIAATSTFSTTLAHACFALALVGVTVLVIT